MTSLGNIFVKISVELKGLGLQYLSNSYLECGFLQCSYSKNSYNAKILFFKEEVDTLVEHLKRDVNISSINVHEYYYYQQQVKKIK